MRLSRFIFLLSFATFFALLYVYQQSEIFRLGYAAEKRAAVFQDLLDKNTWLRYNIESNASLVRIGNKISSTRDYEMPGAYEVVRIAQPPSARRIAQTLPVKKPGLIAKIFSVRQEAQAKTINP